jgi:hypothetical protein
MGNFISYAAAVAAIRSAGLTPGVLHGAAGEQVPVGSPADITQADLLLAVLSLHSAVPEGELLPGGGYAEQGLAGFAAKEPEGGWATWGVRWHTHPESGLVAEFTNGTATLLYDEEEGLMPVALAEVLNTSVWPAARL